MARRTLPVKSEQMRRDAARAASQCAVEKVKSMSQSTKSSLTEEELDYRAALADCFVDLGEACVHKQAYDDALKYLELASHCFNNLNGDVSSLRVEAGLRALANILPNKDEKSHVEPVGGSSKPVCLHVMNEASAFGGLISTAKRWIRMDGGDSVHSVALLSQQLPPPADLVQAVSESGGTIYIADQQSSSLQRAAWLRNLSRQVATRVILHIDSCNMIAAMAFGRDGGPPVLLVNHPGHMFWVGASAPDIVVNVRGSQFEVHWTKVHRGAKYCATIPIPLLEPESLSLTEADRDELKLRARESLGVPKDAVVIMTSGASYKFRPLGNIDFLKTCEEILEAVPEAYLLAAGVIEDDRWREASNRSGGRLRALGSLPQNKIVILHQASDLYIEGFPFGSTTALLEAGLYGLPAILTPVECPPPYGSDGVALDDTLERPASVEQYKLEAIRLCQNPSERSFAGIKLQKSILAHHTGAGWRRYLANAIQALPPEHRLHPLQTPVRTPPAIYEYWCAFMGTREPSRSVLEDRIFSALSSGLRPKITQKMKLACKRAERLRSSRTMPVWLLSLLCNYFLPLLPLSSARLIFRTVKFFFLGELASRMRNKLVRLLRLSNDSQSHFEHQYRYIQENNRWFGAANQVTQYGESQRSER
jgi:hypothetical protein